MQKAAKGRAERAPERGTSAPKKSPAPAAPAAKIRNPSSSPTRPIIDVLDNQLKQLAGELQRRRSGAPSQQQQRQQQPQQPPVTRQQHKPAKEDDPTEMLNTWLGELDMLQKDLEVPPFYPSTCGNHTRMAPTALSSATAGGSFTLGRVPSNGAANRDSMSSSIASGSTVLSPGISRESSATPVNMRRLSTPRVESPRLDSYRYSLMNLEESLENDLDAILGELCALESNFNNLTSGSPPQRKISPPSGADTPTEPPPPPAPLQLEELLSTSSEPQYISPESVRQNKLLTKRTDSPDNDSAFCENTSSNSSTNSNNNNNNNSGSGSSAKANANGPREPVAEKSNGVNKAVQSAPQTHQGQHEQKCSQSSQDLVAKVLGSSLKNGHGSAEEDLAAKAKAEKIRLAIEKIKEASIKKIFIKVFGEDGSAKSLLVDERMTVAQVCGMLAEKHHVKRDTSWGLVELLPDLHMERSYEDHELLVENLLMWKADSKNTLWFIKRAEVYDLFVRPERYLLGDTSSQSGSEMEDRARAELIEEYFSSSGVGAPEVEGTLWLKAEGKKTWKKFYFVLRTSGLYYAPKGKKTSKDLVCLARFDVNQVYFGVKWQPKFKAPTKHCFAIKHPQIQAKNPKYIRYLCSDTELDLNKWVTGIRLAKYGRTLYENYRNIIEDIAHDDIDRLASARLSVNSANQIQLASSPMANNAQEFSSGRDSRSQAESISSVTPSQTTTKVIVHSSLNGGVTCKSSRRTSTSSSTNSSAGDNNVSSSSASQEQGFSCDSPEGGTIKKKPASGSNGSSNGSKSALVTFRSPAEGSKLANKEVRFKDTFSMIPDSPPALRRLSSSPSSSPSPQYGSLKRNLGGGGKLSLSQHETAVYQNIEDILSSHKAALQQAKPSQTNGIQQQQQQQSQQQQALPQLDFPESPLKRRFSQESLVSNPAMLHCGTVISSSASSESVLNSGAKPASGSAEVIVSSPQPQRPAPVLKPQVGRKPSIDKSFLLKKQMEVSPKPSYEDTLKKCQSLTRSNSNPSTPPPVLQEGQQDQQQVPVKSPSPAVPPKPSLASRALASARLDNSKKISHLPPSGRSSSLNRANGANNSNASFLADLEQAMSAKRSLMGKFEQMDTDEPSMQPFPNRLSSGEYDNVSNGCAQNQTPVGILKEAGSKKVPPLPRRNDETQLSWNRT